MKNHHETFMQTIIALGIAANHIAKACPAQFKHCRDTAIKADEILNQFREMPTWKKKRFNELVEMEEEDFMVLCGNPDCAEMYDIRACPLCNHINED